MKIMWLSVAPWAPTGYGQQTGIFAPRIQAAGHDVAISSTNGLQYTEIMWEGIKCYPADHTSLNKRMLKHHIRKEYGDSADVQVITLWDIWPWVDPEMGGGMADFDGLNIAAWVPIDCKPVPPKTRVALDKYNVTPIAMSRFGEEELRIAGYDPLYVPHGIETAIYRPHDDRDRCKQSMGIDPGRFVVGMVAFNQGIQPPRKAFPQVLLAFKVFHDKHPDALLYLHTEVLGVYQGLNLLALSEVMGIPNDAISCVPQNKYLGGEISKERMAQVYSAMDVLANPSYGEGFGIPIVEAQACGTPVVVSAWTSMPELCGAGWQVGGQPWYNPSSGGLWLDPDAEQIVAAFEEAYGRRGDMELRQQAREFAMQYDADLVMDTYWKPALEQLGRPKEVPPLPNRQVRRAIAKAGKPQGKVAARTSP